MAARLEKIEQILTDNTVLDDWFSPMRRALDKVRYPSKIFHTLSMQMFILQNCVRQLNSSETLREHLQHLFHLNEEAKKIPLASPTYSDALSSKAHLDIVEKAAIVLSKSAT